MSKQENEAFVWRGWEMINEGKWEAVEDLHSCDYVSLAPGGQELIDVLCGTLPDLHFTIEDLIASGDKVMSRFTVRGTHRGEIHGIAPTGKSVTVSGIVISRIKGTKVVEDWEEYDRLCLMQQIGAIRIPT